MRIFIEVYIGIENYIINFLFFIKNLLILKDPISLIKAHQSMELLSQELFMEDSGSKFRFYDSFDKKAKSAQGLLIFSLFSIFEKCNEIIKFNITSKEIGYIQEIIKRHLNLLSIFIKYCRFFNINYLLYKCLYNYTKTFDLGLKLISNKKNQEQIILKSNLLFNISGILIKNTCYCNAYKIYNKIIKMHKKTYNYSFVCGAAYYNLCVLLFAMGKINESELYINEALEKISKLSDTTKSNKTKDDLRTLILLLILFYAELYIDKEKFDKATHCLQTVLEIIILRNRIDKIKHKTQGSQEARVTFKFTKKRGSIVAEPVEFDKTDDIFKYSLRPQIMPERRSLMNFKYTPVTALDFLFEINFYSNSYEKVNFEEKTKNMVNGLFDKINYLQSEKFNKSHTYYIIDRKKNNSQETSTKKSILFANKMKAVKKKCSTEYELEGNLPDLDMKIIINNSQFKYNPVFEQQPKTIDRTNTLMNKNKSVMNKEEKEFLTRINEEDYITNEKQENIISYLNDEMIKKKKIFDNEKDISDFINFFLLLTSLSYRQIEILNETQNTNMSSDLFKNLPILFSKQFKNSLNQAQRAIFEKLRILSLVRCKILKNDNKPISLDNINYNIFHANIKFNEYNKLKSFNHVQNVIKRILEIGYDKNKRRRERSILHLPISNNRLGYSLGRLTERKINDRRESVTKSLIRSFIVKNEKNYLDSNSTVNMFNYNKNSSENDSNSENTSSSGENTNVEFKYEGIYDIQSLREKIIENSKEYIIYYSEEEIQKFVEIVNSNLFIQIINCLELKDIKRIEKMPEMLIEMLLKEIREVLNIRKKEIETLKKNKMSSQKVLSVKEKSEEVSSESEKSDESSESDSEEDKDIAVELRNSNLFKENWKNTKTRKTICSIKNLNEIQCRLSNKLTDEIQYKNDKNN